jgi:hypothetical protein
MIEHVSLRTAWLRDRINYITLHGERREVIIIAAVVGPVRWCKEGEWIDRRTPEVSAWRQGDAAPHTMLIGPATPS